MFSFNAIAYMISGKPPLRTLLSYVPRTQYNIQIPFSYVILSSKYMLSSKPGTKVWVLNHNNKVSKFVEAMLRGKILVHLNCQTRKYHKHQMCFYSDSTYPKNNHHRNTLNYDIKDQLLQERGRQ